MAEAQRLGTAPADRSEANRSTDAGACPDILLIPDSTALGLKGTEGMRNGPVYGVIGTLATREQIEQFGLPKGAGVAEHEVMVFIPEEVLLSAAADLLTSRASAAAAV